MVAGGAGRDFLQAGGGPTTLKGGPDNDQLVAGPSVNVLNGGPGADIISNVKPLDVLMADALDKVFRSLISSPPPEAGSQLSTDDVAQLLARAAAASASNDAIITIVDRNGRLLGLRVEGGVSPTITGNNNLLVYAVDGALAKARTAAFFANNQAPLTSRTVQFISQTTMTQREIESYPSITNPDSILRGPGFVAPIGIRGHFPPNVPFTPQVDLFAIEHTNRDSIIHPGADRIKGTADDVTLPARFNINPAFIPQGVTLYTPESYGYLSGLQPGAQARGIATLPGGIPIFKNGAVVGGIGVFFPGTTGFATEENSMLNSNFDITKPDRSYEAEFIAFAALGGSSQASARVGSLAGILPVAGIDLPAGRLDLVGITLDVFGPGGSEGVQNLVTYGSGLGIGNPNSGSNRPVGRGPDGMPNTGDEPILKTGVPVPSGWLVTPHNGQGLNKNQVTRIINQAIVQALQTRAAIRLPLGSRSRMVFAVTDKTGTVLGLYRMPDATFFSIDVAVAKARNTAYYADPNSLQPIDKLPTVPRGVAFTNRTFRFLALPRLPEGIDGKPPGPFSILTDGGVNFFNGLNVGARLPASAYTSVQGYDAFNPGTNFRDPFNILNQNGIVFFPGSSPVYVGTSLRGGFGVSGDGVDQDDVVTTAGINGFAPILPVRRADQFFFSNVRLPYNKFNRNPTG
jgi:uncharacterized protein GlcG (DUF336 family)